MFKSIIAIAALMVCSGAWAELTKEQENRFWRLGNCSNAYLFAVLASIQGYEGSSDIDLAVDRVSALEEMAKNEAAELATGRDGFEAGIIFADRINDMEYFEFVAEVSGNQAAEIKRLEQIIKHDCESLFPARE